MDHTFDNTDKVFKFFYIKIKIDYSHSSKNKIYIRCISYE